MLLTLTGRMVRSWGDGETAGPGDGRVDLTPATHGIHDGALRNRETVRAPVEGGVMEPIDLTPGTWSVSIRPDKGAAWPEFLIELTEGMPEPVDLATLAPVVVVDGEKWAKGDPGPAGASVTGAVDNGDQTVSFTLSDGSETAPVPIPPGPQGERGPSGQDGAPGIPGEQGLPGEPGEPGIDGAPGAPGPANTLAIGTVSSGATASATITGEAPAQTLSLILPKGDKGDKGDPGATGAKGDPGAATLMGPGRPDMPATTSGAITGAETPGTEYISTDGAGVGAWKWILAGTTWTVLFGDTGLRNVTTLINTQGTFAGTAYLYRVGGTASLLVSRLSGASAHLLPVTAGFQALSSAVDLNVAALADNSISLVGQVKISLSRRMPYWWSSSSTSAGSALLSWPTTDPWPTTLPGTPA